MADLTSANITISGITRQIVGREKRVRATIAFGNGALTYPALGVPLPVAKNFRLYKIKSGFVLPASGNGLIHKYDVTNNKIRIWQGAGFTPAGTVAAPVFTGAPLAAHRHDLIVIGGITADEPVGLLASGPTLGKLAATDRTIAGVDSATKGGVVDNTAGTPAGSNAAPAFTGTAIAAGALAEFSGAPAATTLVLELTGI